jgi:hypothetical protein
MTIYPARRVEWTMMCGRRGVDGRYVCQGVVGTAGVTVDGMRTSPLPGYVESPEAGTYVLSRHAAGKRDGSAHAPTFRRKRDTTSGKVTPATLPSLPWRVRCPHCGELAEVAAKVL